MQITEVRIKLMDGVQDRLLGFCSITFDRAFVIRDLKIIKGSKGAFVAMPSRKLTDRCPACGNKNEMRAAYCSQCGIELGGDRSAKTLDGRARLYADIAHPIHSDCRDMIQNTVLDAYDLELGLAQQPDYVCRYDDFGEFEFERDAAEPIEEVNGHGNGNGNGSRYESAKTRWDRALNSAPAGRPHGFAAPEAAVSKFHGSDEFGDGLF